MQQGQSLVLGEAASPFFFRLFTCCTMRNVKKATIKKSRIVLMKMQ